MADLDQNGLLNEVEHWRILAAQARKLADELSDDLFASAKMYEIAGRYDEMAARGQERVAANSRIRA